MSRHRIFGLLLGRATSEQLMLSCLLGGVVGFTPWDHTGAALIALSCAALLVLNASVPLFTAVVGITSILALAAHRVVDSVGAALLSGPLGGLMARVAETPLLAWADWESNRVTGGAALGILFGVLVGVLLAQLVGRVRARLASLEEGSEAFRAWTAKAWVRALAWLLLGGLPKEGFQATLELEGRWWRPAGVLATAVLIVGSCTYLSLAQAKGIRGALVGSLFVAALGNWKRGLLLIAGSFLSGVGLMLLATIPVYFAAIGVMVLLGLGDSGRRTLLMALIMEEVEDRYQGRVMSVFMMNYGLMPLGVLPAAAVAQFVGAREAVALLAVLLLAATLIILVTQRRLREVD